LKHTPEIWSCVASTPLAKKVMILQLLIEVILVVALAEALDEAELHIESW
jgi:hypothetical protein